MKVTDEMVDGAIATFAAGGGFEPSEWDKVAWRAKMRDAITAALSHAAGQEAVAWQNRDAGTDKWYDCSREYYETLLKHPYDRATLRRQELRALAPAKPPASAEVESKYSELIYAVAQKWPGETRHQTALRYIMERENIAPSEAPASERQTPVAGVTHGTEQVG